MFNHQIFEQNEKNKKAAINKKCRDTFVYKDDHGKLIKVDVNQIATDGDGQYILINNKRYRVDKRRKFYNVSKDNIRQTTEALVYKNDNGNLIKVDVNQIATDNDGQYILINNKKYRVDKRKNFYLAKKQAKRAEEKQRKQTKKAEEKQREQAKRIEEKQKKQQKKNENRSIKKQNRKSNSNNSPIHQEKNQSIEDVVITNQHEMQKISMKEELIQFVKKLAVGEASEMIDGLMNEFKGKTYKDVLLVLFLAERARQDSTWRIAANLFMARKGYTNFLEKIAKEFPGLMIRFVDDDDTPLSLDSHGNINSTNASRPHAYAQLLYNGEVIGDVRNLRINRSFSKKRKNHDDVTPLETNQSEISLESSHSIQQNAVPINQFPSIGNVSTFTKEQLSASTPFTPVIDPTYHLYSPSFLSTQPGFFNNTDMILNPVPSQNFQDQLTHPHFGQYETMQGNIRNQLNNRVDNIIPPDVDVNEDTFNLYITQSNIDYDNAVIDENLLEQWSEPYDPTLHCTHQTQLSIQQQQYSQQYYSAESPQKDENHEPYDMPYKYDTEYQHDTDSFDANFEQFFNDGYNTNFTNFNSTDEAPPNNPEHQQHFYSDNSVISSNPVTLFGCRRNQQTNIYQQPPADIELNKRNTPSNK